MSGQGAFSSNPLLNGSPLPLAGRWTFPADRHEIASQPGLNLPGAGALSRLGQRGLPFGFDFLYLQGKAQGLSAVRRQPGDVNHDRP
jgi:hypothetical protein